MSHLEIKEDAKKKRLKTKFPDLPLDCFTVIIFFFDSHKDFLNLVFSVRGLFKYVSSHCNACTEAIEFPVHNIPRNEAFHVHRIQIKTKGAKRICGISKSKNIGFHYPDQSFNKLNILLEKFPNLSSFSLKTTANVTFTIGKTRKMKVFSRIKTLNFHGGRITIHFPSFPNLENLLLWSMTHAISVSGDSLPKIKCLDIRYCHSDRFILPEGLFATFGRTLESLFVQNNTVPIRGSVLSSFVTGLPKLREFCVKNVCSPIFVPRLQVVSLPSLEIMTLSDERSFFEVNFSTLPKLKKMRIENVFDQTFQDSMLDLKRLEELEIVGMRDMEKKINPFSSCSKIDCLKRIVVQDIKIDMTEEKSLRIMDLEYLCELSIERVSFDFSGGQGSDFEKSEKGVIIKHCPSLKLLRIRECEFHDEFRAKPKSRPGVGEAEQRHEDLLKIDSNPKLERLDLDGNSFFFGWTVQSESKYLCIHNCPGLKELKLSRLMDFPRGEYQSSPVYVSLKDFGNGKVCLDGCVWSSLEELDVENNKKNTQTVVLLNFKNLRTQKKGNIEFR